MRYLVVVEKGATSYVRMSPTSRVASPWALASIHEAVEFHLEGLKEDGEPIPPPSSSGELVEVAA